MTATEELRRLLDERGVEYQAIGNRFTYWNRDGSSNVCDDADFVADGQNGSLTVAGLTPEQAVDATLGPGTCHKLPSSGDTVCIVRRREFEWEFGYWKCSECGCECFDGARYCMNCGRKVEE